MAENLSREEVKKAIREVMDETSITYAQGAGKFIDSALRSLADIVDAYDEFFTNNLISDRPELADIFLDLRLSSLNTVNEIVQKKNRGTEVEANST